MYVKAKNGTKQINSTNYFLEVYIDIFNQRIRIDNYRGNMTLICNEIDRMVEKHSITKIIFYTRPEHWHQLLSKGFVLEAIIKGYFNGTDNYIMAYYKNNQRKTSEFWIQQDSILQTIFTTNQNIEDALTSNQYQIRKATSKDAQKLSELYGKVFEIYPTPMNNTEYVKEMIGNGVVFYIVECEEELVSAASADINQTLHHAELTDCATLPEHRKYGLMKQLLMQLESDLKNKRIFSVFSIARGLSFGMNKAFYQLGYQYNGRLINNCYIFDKLEDMNVWVKDLSS